jgi:transposase
MDSGFKVHLANPSAIQQYSGLEHADDKHDAFWLAQMLRLGILPEGYIYPKEDRPIRDLLRKRRHLVRLRTSLILSLQNIISRNFGVSFRANEVKRLKEDRVSPLLEILLQNPQSKKREKLRKIVSGAVGTENSLKIF